MNKIDDIGPHFAELFGVDHFLFKEIALVREGVNVMCLNQGWKREGKGIKFSGKG